MKIILTFPTIASIHGGARIIFEWCYRLKKIGHETALFVENGKTQCDWYDLSGITVTADRNAYKHYDCIVIGSPHSIWLQDHIKPHQKCFLFMQMVEEKFRPNDGLWEKQCKQFYLSRFPIIHGSYWGEDHVRRLGRTGAMHYIGNGVNLEHFPISNNPKDGKTILLESPFSRNPAKDVAQLALKVAMKLKKDGFRIIGYGSDNPTGYPFLLDEYICKPSLGEMNRMYAEATILVKATKWDARALSPIEAMAKGCVTARAIIDGDDDLIHLHNCLKVEYDYDYLLRAAQRLLNDECDRKEFARNALNYVQKHCNWDIIINQLNKILTA